MIRMFRPYCKDNGASCILITPENCCPGSFMGCCLFSRYQSGRGYSPHLIIVSYFQTMIHSGLFESLIALPKFSPANTNQ